MKESSSDPYRLFVAIPIPEAVKDEIERAQDELRRALGADAVRWTKRNQFHLTLKFLGDVESRRVLGVKSQLVRACAPFAPLRLRSERVGFFPDLRHPRVVWVWAHDAANELSRLQRAVEFAMTTFASVPVEGEFTGHITLGRAKQIRRPQADILARLALGMTDRFFGEWVADSVELIRSELGSDAARYTTVATVPLTGGLAK